MIEDSYSHMKDDARQDRGVSKKSGDDTQLGAFDAASRKATPADYALDHYMLDVLVERIIVRQVLSAADAMRQALPYRYGKYDRIVWTRLDPSPVEITSVESLTLEERDPKTHANIVARFGRRILPLFSRHDSE